MTAGYRPGDGQEPRGAPPRPPNRHSAVQPPGAQHPWNRWCRPGEGHWPAPSAVTVIVPSGEGERPTGYRVWRGEPWTPDGESRSPRKSHGTARLPGTLSHALWDGLRAGCGRLRALAGLVGATLPSRRRQGLLEAEAVAARAWREAERRASDARNNCSDIHQGIEPGDAKASYRAMQQAQAAVDVARAAYDAACAARDGEKR